MSTSMETTTNKPVGSMKSEATIPELSIRDARRILLDSQGLLNPRAKWAGKAGALQAIEHLGYLQIDTINIIERTHHHVLFSRVKDYASAHLHGLQDEDRAVFEFWTHALSYVPVRDYRYYLPFMKDVRSGAMGWYNPRPTAWMKKVLARIEKEGPLGVSDFEERVRKRTHPWGGTKVAKRVLERLKYEGALTVVSRRGFEKIYELTERALPKASAHLHPTPEEMHEYHVTRAERAFGIFSAENALHLRKKKTVAELARYIEKNRERLGFVPVRIEGSPTPRWMSRARLEKLPALRTLSAKKTAHLLSPFDPILIQRKVLSDFFGYDYTIECYVPAPKRKFGYFCLPILYGDEFVGRADCKAHRKEGVLEIISLHQESGVEDATTFARAFREEVERFARFNGCANGIRITKKKLHRGKSWLKEIRG